MDTVPLTTLQDMAAFALSSPTLAAQARGLAVGTSLHFTPGQIVDGSPAQQALAARLSMPFVVRRIALADIPAEYGLQEGDLAPGTLAFLVAPQAEPGNLQLATLDPQ